MSAQHNDGGFAFPFGQVSEATGQPINGFFNPGMSLRDWFAGQALIGLLAQEDADRLEVRARVAKEEGIRINLLRAKMSYEQADAMIQAREEKQ